MPLRGVICTASTCPRSFAISQLFAFFAVMVSLPCYLVSHLECEATSFFRLDYPHADEIDVDDLQGLAGVVDRLHQTVCPDCTWRADPEQFYITKRPTSDAELTKMISLALSSRLRLKPIEQSTSVKQLVGQVITMCTPASGFIMLCGRRNLVSTSSASQLQPESELTQEQGVHSRHEQSRTILKPLASSSRKEDIPAILEPVGENGLYLVSLSRETKYNTPKSSDKALSFRYRNPEIHHGETNLLVDPMKALDLLFKESPTFDETLPIPSTTVYFLHGYDVLGKTALLSALSMSSDWDSAAAQNYSLLEHQDASESSLERLPRQLCLVIDCSDFDVTSTSSTSMTQQVSSAICQALLVFLSEKHIQTSLGLNAKDALTLIDFTKEEGHVLLEKILSNVRKTSSVPVIVTVDNFDVGILRYLLCASHNRLMTHRVDNPTLIHRSVRSHLLDPLSRGIKLGYISRIVFSSIFRDVADELELIFQSGNIDVNFCNAMSKVETPVFRLGLSVKQATDIVHHLGYTEPERLIQELREYAGSYFDDVFQSDEYMRLDFSSEFFDIYQMGEGISGRSGGHSRLLPPYMTPVLTSALASFIANSDLSYDLARTASDLKTPISIGSASYEGITSFEAKTLNDLLHHLTTSRSCPPNILVLKVLYGLGILSFIPAEPGQPTTSLPAKIFMTSPNSAAHSILRCVFATPQLRLTKSKVYTPFKGETQWIIESLKVHLCSRPMKAAWDWAPIGKTALAFLLRVGYDLGGITDARVLEDVVVADNFVSKNDVLAITTLRDSNKPRTYVHQLFTVVDYSLPGLFSGENERHPRWDNLSDHEKMRNLRRRLETFTNSQGSNARLFLFRGKSSQHELPLPTAFVKERDLLRSKVIRLASRNADDPRLRCTSDVHHLDSSSLQVWLVFVLGSQRVIVEKMEERSLDIYYKTEI
ncbi:hypothetical protein FISHEDRAFT_58991 [Fistulina hepatica ATCC 64428]|uniref:Uncharacterized protein n=1 Tax=Fistulina hepatica ATCC 64428 TaxID=1128425 RepID=A0A0D7ACL3_9AGAR|nr:hypothetical protein FISHEDRAFT_58991 [Fistulina hepatica ATCC 64428]